MGYRHKTLLNQARTDTPGAKPLGEKNILKLHGRHGPIVAAQNKPPAYLAKRRLPAVADAHTF